MKDIYTDRVANNLDSCVNKANVVKGMITGERPADPKLAESYLQQIVRVLEDIKEVVERG